MKKLKFFNSVFVLPLIFTILSLSINQVRAGEIRKLVIPPNKTGTITLAPGRTTVISFIERPEKVVPGSPGAVEVNFIGKDITIRPLHAHPGNLIIYSRSNRFVILFRMGNESAYDDVVSIAPSINLKKINLALDTFKVDNVQLSWNEGTGKKRVTFSVTVPVRVSKGDTEIESSELYDSLKDKHQIVCDSCTLKRNDNVAQIHCKKSIESIICQASAGQFQIRRVIK